MLKIIARSNKFIFLAIIILLSSCGDYDFHEYPPSNYLSESEQIGLLNKFIRAQYQQDFSLDRETRKMYELRYFTQIKSKNYFMISYKGNFFSSGIFCYGGEMNVKGKDTTINLSFTAQIPTHFTEDSVKILYERMLEK